MSHRVLPGIPSTPRPIAFGNVLDLPAAKTLTFVEDDERPGMAFFKDEASGQWYEIEIVTVERVAKETGVQLVRAPSSAR